MASGLGPYRVNRCDFSPVWLQCPPDTSQAWSGAQWWKTLHPVAWLWLILRARCGNWTKIRFSHSNLFEKDAREKLQLAARDGTVMGQDRSKDTRSFSVQLCSVPSTSTLPPLISGCKLRKVNSASSLLETDWMNVIYFCCLHLMPLINTLFLIKKKSFSKGLLNFSLQIQSLKTSLPLSSLQWFHPNPSYALHSYPLLRGNDKFFSDTELGSSVER